MGKPFSIVCLRHHGFSRPDICYQHSRLLTCEQASKIRHEYIAGQLFAMVRVSRAHNAIALNIASSAQQHLSIKPWWQT
jgi:hypothetical protein